jgi:hypothetical protein
METLQKSEQKNLLKTSSEKTPPKVYAPWQSVTHAEPPTKNWLFSLNSWVSFAFAERVKDKKSKWTAHDPALQLLVFHVQ